MRGKLEVCVDSVESAVIAAENGGDRLEVCANLIIGGTTPGVSQFRQIRKACDLALHVLVRPRFGDFLYTDAEFQMIEEDIRMFRELGADGIVVGCLQADGSLDLDRMKRLKECAGPLHLTLHRAFDLCRNPYQALEEAVTLGIDTILTSGQASACMEGKDVLEKLILQAEDRIEIMVGSGVSAQVISRLAKEIHAYSFHMSGKRMTESGMIYQKEQVNMGLPGFSEYGILRTDKEEIQKARRVIDSEM